MEKEDLNIVSDFLVMAATLLDIKSRMLLPALETEEGEEEDPRAELVARLLEYKKYKLMAQELADMEEEAGDVLFKMPTVPKEVAKYEPPVDLDKLLDGLTLAKLQRILILSCGARRRRSIRSEANSEPSNGNPSVWKRKSWM